MDVYTDDNGRTYTEFQLRCLVELYLLSHPGVYPQTMEAQDLLTELLIDSDNGPSPMEHLNLLGPTYREELNRRIKRRMNRVS